MVIIVLSSTRTIRHLTTFITPWGRFPYRVCPQGFKAAQDGYSRRFDEIVSDVPNKTKCIDDTLMWQDTVKECFHQAVDWLDLCGRNGITLTPKKIQFAEENRLPVSRLRWTA